MIKQIVEPASLQVSLATLEKDLDLNLIPKFNSSNANVAEGMKMVELVYNLCNTRNVKFCMEYPVRIELNL